MKRETLYRSAHFLAAILILGPGCTSSMTCGPGTHAEGSTCVPDLPGDADADVDVDAVAEADPEADHAVDEGVEPDAVGDEDAVEPDAEDAPDGEVIPCGRQCDCPAGTTCTIEGVCEGDPCTEPCDDAGDCDCDQPCTGGYCLPHVGSGEACTYNCDCPDWQYCVEGRCITSCVSPGWRCVLPTDCDACGKVCETFSSSCVEPGECYCSLSCAIQGLRGEECYENHCSNPPGTAFFSSITDPIPIGAWDFSPSSPLPTQDQLQVTGLSAVGGVTLVIDADSLSGFDIMHVFALVGPDGTRVFISSPSWDCAGGGVRYVIPRRTDTWDPFSDFIGGPATGTWTLEAGDGSLVPGVRLVDWVLFIE